MSPLRFLPTMPAGEFADCVVLVQLPASPAMPRSPAVPPLPPQVVLHQAAVLISARKSLRPQHPQQQPRRGM